MRTSMKSDIKLNLISRLSKEGNEILQNLMERENSKKLEIGRLSKRKSIIFQQDCNDRRNKTKVMVRWNFGDDHLRHCLLMSSELNQVLKNRQNE